MKWICYHVVCACTWPSAHIKVNFCFLLCFCPFQALLLCSCFRFHLHGTTCRKSSPSPPKQALGPCWGIRENGVHVIRRLAGLFSFPVLFFFGRHTWEVVTLTWSKGVAVHWALRATRPVALGSMGPLPIPPRLLRCCCLGPFPLVTSREAMSEAEGGSSFSIACSGVHAAPSSFLGCLQSLLPRLEVATLQSPVLGGGWLCQSQARHQFKICQRKRIIVSSPVCTSAIFSL